MEKCSEARRELNRSKESGNPMRVKKQAGTRIPKCPSSMSIPSGPDRRRVFIACLNCRQRKIKCITNDTEQRPCDRCIQKGLICEYKAIRNDEPDSPPTESAWCWIFLFAADFGIPPPFPARRRSYIIPCLWQSALTSFNKYPGDDDTSSSSRPQPGRQPRGLAPQSGHLPEKATNPTSHGTVPLTLAQILP
ncbi:hypothetical protein C8R43DRAFT_248728 [Mycena crocata]|nr:hypothetical protein C8R43DRAFT_248728 [Mycena crocata]